MFKRLISLVLTLCCLLTVACSIPVAAAATEDDGIMPCYNNTLAAGLIVGIDENGLMTITYNLIGETNVTTRIDTETYIEKRFLGIFWTRVDIGTSDNVWYDTIYGDQNITDRTFQLSNTGTYRVNVKYTVYGSGGVADVIEFEEKETY